jgi:hypothetical protein
MWEFEYAVLLINGIEVNHDERLSSELPSHEIFENILDTQGDPTKLKRDHDLVIRTIWSGRGLFRTMDIHGIGFLVEPLSFLTWAQQSSLGCREQVDQLIDKLQSTAKHGLFRNTEDISQKSSVDSKDESDPSIMDPDTPLSKEKLAAARPKPNKHTIDKQKRRRRVLMAAVKLLRAEPEAYLHKSSGKPNLTALTLGIETLSDKLFDKGIIPLRGRRLTDALREELRDFDPDGVKDEG